MDTFIILIIIQGLVILLPPAAMWRSVSRHSSGRKAWCHHALALFGPFTATFIFSVLASLPAYSGRCGGWLGETSPCPFGQYATEVIYWAAMAMAIPALFGMLLAVVILIISLFKLNDPTR